MGGAATEIDPAKMPLTRLANTAIDGVSQRLDAVADDLCAYAQTDLLAYRAADPDKLVSAQARPGIRCWIGPTRRSAPG